jgi:hypothetical protein
MSFPYDRRKSYRAAIQWPVTIQTAEGHVEARLKDLSIDGAYIDCEQTLNPHVFFSMTIDPPNRSSLKITAEVMRADELLSPGIGVRFVQMSERDRHFLVNEVSDYLESK